jgi:pSer/pThr/pTyr-binding forkhead associated (FHA) protein
VNDPLIARFADSCGATAPLDLRVDLVGGGVLAQGTVHQPFTLVGRADACDVTLTDSEIDPRHVWLQVLGGRVFAVDLGSRTGLTWPNGARGSGWLDVSCPVRVGPFHLRLRAPASDKPSPYAADYNPLAADPTNKARPLAALEFRNGRRAKDRWNVNRLVTLVGRSPDCKIHLTADDISPYHCGIVAARTGLWVVDLSGRGVVVNGERMRVAALGHGAELWVGRFLIGVQPPTVKPAPPAPAPAASAAPGVSGRLAVRAPVSAPAPVPVPPLPAPAPPPNDDDEVELGAEPEVNGLPASHILADAFRDWSSGASGPMSNPIHVSGGNSNGGTAVQPPAPAEAVEPTPAPTASDDWSLVPVLRQMADLHGRTVAEFQQTLSLVAQMFDRARREHLAVLQHELTRIHDLTAEIVALQSEVARQALERSAAERAKRSSKPGPAASDSGIWSSPSAKTPLPDVPAPRPAADPPTPTAAARAADRLRALYHDRATRWQALVELFAAQ